MWLSISHNIPQPSYSLHTSHVLREAAIAVSNVAIFNPQTGKGDRVGFKVLEDGTKERFYKSTGEVIGG